MNFPRLRLASSFQGPLKDWRGVGRDEKSCSKYACCEHPPVKYVSCCLQLLRVDLMDELGFCCANVGLMGYIEDILNDIIFTKHLLRLIVLIICIEMNILKKILI